MAWNCLHLMLVLRWLHFQILDNTEKIDFVLLIDRVLSNLVRPAAETTLPRSTNYSTLWTLCLLTHIGSMRWPVKLRILVLLVAEFVLDFKFRRGFAQDLRISGNKNSLGTAGAATNISAIFGSKILICRSFRFLLQSNGSFLIIFYGNGAYLPLAAVNRLLSFLSLLICLVLWSFREVGGRKFFYCLTTVAPWNLNLLLMGIWSIWLDGSRNLTDLMGSFVVE